MGLNSWTCTAGLPRFSVLTGEWIAALEAAGEDRAMAPEGGTAAGQEAEVAREPEAGMGTATEKGGLATPPKDRDGHGMETEL